ncbi:MAG TPA: TRAP transporter small permease [Rhodopila sp.]|uniref:TRAP transporter small permease n=1 Tax=Rhodopila sp. TaxID=2480087 RepID=UPI002C26DF2E|nr:TRAP transporter small permease [Rhodopila sp.]HVY17990.1 TRAP transporter small permease [Rhodopila sp.]
MGNDPEALEDRFHPAPTWLEKSCMAVCAISIIAMGLIVISEIVTRNLFGFSFEVSEELGGYIIVGISFLSLPVCQVYRSYHHVQFVQARLSPRMQALSHILFDVLSLLFCLILLWQLTRYAMSSYQSGDQAPTPLGTPLWIPATTMPLGVLAASVSLLRSLIGNCRRFRANRA